MRRTAAITRLWRETFDETHVITVSGNEARVERLVATLPFDPALLTVDSCAPLHDCLARRPARNHHLVVGNRHKQVIEAAARARRRNVFVFEDDAEFGDDDPERLARALGWAKTHAAEWDVFYLGFLAPLLSACSYRAPGIVRVHHPLLAHALCYNARVFDRVLAIDFTADHRPALNRVVERVASPGARRTPYFRDGVGSLDSWLSFSGLRRLAAHPMLVVQTSLPPGTAEGWSRRTGRPYHPWRTPRLQVRLALGVYYARAAALLLAGLALVAAAAKC
jgi:hypothetical protein